jgi:hypothetical protein
MKSGTIGYLLNPSKVISVRINELQKVIKDNFKDSFNVNTLLFATFIENADCDALCTMKKTIGMNCNVIDMFVKEKKLLIRCNFGITPKIITIDIGEFTLENSIELFNAKWIQMLSQSISNVTFTIDNVQLLDGVTYEIIEEVITVENMLNNLKEKRVSLTCE